MLHFPQNLFSWRSINNIIISFFIEPYIKKIFTKSFKAVWACKCYYSSSYQQHYWNQYSVVQKIWKRSLKMSRLQKKGTENKKWKAQQKCPSEESFMLKRGKAYKSLVRYGTLKRDRNFFLKNFLRLKLNKMLFYPH